MVQLSGAVVWLALVAGLAQGGPGGQGPDQCASQCQQVYSLHTGQYEQVGRWHWQYGTGRESREVHVATTTDSLTFGCLVSLPVYQE